jgi:hypothetical protein
LDKQLRANHAEFPLILRRSAANVRGLDGISANLALHRPFAAGFADSQRGSRRGVAHSGGWEISAAGDCFSNRLRKVRHASNGRVARKPTCAIEHFFHT